MDNAFFLNFTSGDKSLYAFKLSNLINEDYVPFGNDAIKMFTIQLIIQFMILLKEQSLSVLFNLEFFELLVYVTLGLAFYWFVMRKILIVE